jgi:callose synthase
LVYTFLEPLFVPVGSDTAMVFLSILAFNGALVGMALGVLLPTFFSGICLGATIALLIGAFVSALGVFSSVYFFPVLAGAAALLFSLLSAR